jgi:hypothetical protein
MGNTARIVAVLLAGSLLWLPASNAWAVDPNLHWQTLEGPHFEVEYHDGEAALAAHMLDEAEDAAARLNPWLQWIPRDRVELVLTDHEDLPNGLTTMFPRNHVELYVSPPDDLDSLEDFDDWFRLLITHEYTHVLQLDKVTGFPAALHYGFGRNYLLFPGLFQPTMLLEGLAVYDETDAAQQVGRGQGSLYAMYMRAEVAHGVRSWSQVTMAGVTEWPQGALPYLYGVNFYQFAAKQYGRERIPELVDNYSSHFIPFLVGHNISETFGDDIPELWPKFDTYLHDRYGEPPYPAGTAIVEGERLTHHGYATASPRATGDGRVFYVRDDQHQHPAIMVWEAGKGSRELTEVFSPARLDWNAKAGLLVAYPDVCDEYHFNFDLYRVDADSGAIRRLTHCGRYHYAAWSPDGSRIVASRMELGESSLVLLDAEGNEIQTLWKGHGGEILGALDWSADGRHVAAALWRPGRRWGLDEFDLDTRGWRTLVEGVGAVGDPQYTPDGGAVLFSSDAGGVYNLRRVQCDGSALTTLTHVASGAFAPTQGSGEGDIYYLGYTAEGYDVYGLPAAAALHESLSPQATAPPPAPAVAHVEGESRAYSPWPSLPPTYWFPELVTAPDVIQVGAATSGQDALGVHFYAGDINYELHHHLVGGSLLYEYSDRLQFLASRFYNVDYSTSGGLFSSNSTNTLDRIRRDDKVQALWQRPWPSLQRTLTFSVGGSSDSEADAYALPGFGEPTLRDTTAGFAFEWNSTQNWPVSISPDDGRKVTFVAESNNVFHNDFRGNAERIDWQEYLRAGDEAVIALRYQEGYGTSGIQPFNLGGANDPGIGTLAAGYLFDRRTFAFPGYPGGLTQLSGDRMRLGSLSWRLPIARPEEGLRLPPVGVHDFSLRLYYDIGGAWDQGGRPAHYSRSVGAEWVSDISAFYLFNLRMVVGAAHGFDTGGENQAYANLEVPLP